MAQQCQYPTQSSSPRKPTLCPSSAHGYAEMDGELVAYCSHHIGVVRAKATLKQETEVSE